MANAPITSEKSSSLSKKLRKKSFFKRSNITSIPKQEQHLVQNIDCTIHQEQVNQIVPDDDPFSDEEEEFIRCSLERRAAILRDTKVAIEKLNKECRRLTEAVSTNVDALLKDLPDAHDPQFEKKYKTVRQKLQELFPKKWNRSKKQTKKK